MQSRTSDGRRVDTFRPRRRSASCWKGSAARRALADNGRRRLASRIATPLEVLLTERASCRVPALERRRLALVEALGPILIGLLGLPAKRARHWRGRFCSSPGRTRVRNGRAPRRGYLPDQPLGHWQRLSQHRDIHRPRALERRATAFKPQRLSSPRPVAMW
jgi:hypothetical protein